MGTQLSPIPLWSLLTGCYEPLSGRVEHPEPGKQIGGGGGSRVPGCLTRLQLQISELRETRNLKALLLGRVAVLEGSLSFFYLKTVQGLAYI